MKREQIQQWIDEGYHVLVDLEPKKVDGDLWEFLDALDEEDNSVLVLEDIIKWSDDELMQLKKPNG